MSLSSIELWQRLTAEGLASPMQCRSWAGEVSKLLPAAETADGLKVLQKLIDIGKLTKYQAKVLAGQSSEPLKRGPWHVLTKVKHPLWQGWLEITKIDTSKGDQPPRRWARWLTATELNSLQSSAPSLPRGIQLANIQAKHLQSIEIPELIDAELQLRVQPVVGSSLAELYAETRLSVENRPSVDQVLQIIQQTASALAAMHEQKVIHGRVTPDRIFWDDTQGVTLVCDPISVWTAGVDPSMTGILGDQMTGLQVASFLAPEFLAPKQPPSSSSDIYALGATWWWLLVGKPPAQGKSIAATLGNAAEVNLDFAARLSHLPEPLRICLEHCLAKNPSARIANARQLCQALSAAQRSLAKGKMNVPKSVTSPTPIAAAKVPPPSKISRASTTSHTPPAQAQPSTQDQLSTQAQLSAQAQSSSPVPSSTPADPVVGAQPSINSQTAAESEYVAPIQSNSARPIAAAKGKAVQPKVAPPKSPAQDVTNTDQRNVRPQPKVAQAELTNRQVDSLAAEAPQPTPQQTPQATPQQTPQATPPQSANSEILASAIAAAEPASPDTLLPNSTAIEPEVSTKAVTKPTVAKTVARPIPTAATTKKPIARRRQRKSKTPLYIVAGFGFVALLLGILKLSGALESSGDSDTASKNQPYTPPVSTGGTKVIAKDPLLERFRIVDSKEALWIPLELPDPLTLDLLPPGAQWYVVLRPAEILANKGSQALLGTFQKQFQLDQLLNQIVATTGQPFESIASVVVAFYNAPTPEQFPASAMRIELVQGKSIEELKASWRVTSEAIVGLERLHVSDNNQAFFVSKDAPSNEIKEFSTGSATLMKEAAELGGAAAPLNAQLKILLSKSSRLNQLVMLGSPRYLFTEGRGLTKPFPARLQNLLEPIFSKDARAALLQVNLADRCYWELQLLGATDADTPRLISKLNDRASTAASEVENWFVHQTPHPYWRALAFRFPQMIRTWREFARFGVEDGIGLANGYLPSDAASNLLVASWIATQDASTMAGQLAQANTSTASDTPTVSPEDILNKPIRLSFDQEPIERALALVGEEANSGVPAASQLRFELDGGAFERAGITRNQQLREFKIDNLPARNALTEIAKRGNPVTTVKDTRELDQRLIWVVKDDPQNPGKKMISLTTRDAAIAAGNPLTVEFAPN